MSSSARNAFTFLLSYPYPVAPSPLSLSLSIQIFSNSSVPIFQTGLEVERSKTVSSYGFVCFLFVVVVVIICFHLRKELLSSFGYLFLPELCPLASSDQEDRVFSFLTPAAQEGKAGGSEVRAEGANPMPRLLYCRSLAQRGSLE